MTLPGGFKKLLLAAGDLAAFIVALFGAILIRYQWENIDGKLLALHVRPFAVLFIVWLLVLYIYNLYDLRHLKNTAAFASLAAQAFAVNAILAALFFYFIPFIGITPRTVLFVDIVLSALLFGLWRLMFNRLLSEKLLEGLAIVGVNEKTVDLARMLAKHPNLGYRIAAFAERRATELPEDLAHIPHVQKLEELAAYRKSFGTIVLAEHPNAAPEITASLFAFLPLNVNFVTLPSFVESALQKIPLSELTESWFLENLSEGKKRLYEAAKRAFDLVFALAFGIVLFPILALIAIGIKLEDGRKTFYRQTRVGKNGKIFRILKFQTMVETAEKDGPKWTERHDPRVTRFGKFLRETRLDELPQLWNIIKGEMSFVGPRPERPEFVEQLKKEIPFYDIRHLVRPGLSGWAQINYPYGSSVADAYEKLQYDIYYIKNRSIALDLSIALKTLSIILRKKGQ